MGTYSTSGSEWLLFWSELNYILLNLEVDEVDPY